MKPVTATVDTNLFPWEHLENKLLALDVRYTTVTARELSNTDIELFNSQPIPETAVWDVSQFDSSIWGSSKTEMVLEDVLHIISNGSFPRRGQRDRLTNGQLNQMHDAMILEAHIREGRDIFISNDTRAFVKHGKREKLESKYQTKILTLNEFKEYCNSMQPD